MDTVKSERQTRMLVVPLTTEEKAAHAEAMADLRVKVDTAEERKKVAAQQAKAEIDALNEEIGVLGGQVRNGCVRDVPVECVWNYETRRYAEIRTDNGEELVDRELTADELQLHFDDIAEPASGTVQ